MGHVTAGCEWDKVPDKGIPRRVAWRCTRRCSRRWIKGSGGFVAELKRSGQLENTVIFFLQDNGGCAETNGRTGNFVAPRRAAVVAGHVGRRPTISAARPRKRGTGWPVRQGYGVMPVRRTRFIAYGRAWANVSNTPFREYKHWVHEGGISTPLIVHWPAGIAAARQGRLESQPGHLIDLMATCVDLAGRKNIRSSSMASPFRRWKG